MPLYEVGVKWDRKIRIEAKNSNDAKRKFCKLTDRKFNDYWCGASILSAKKVKEDGRDE
jgi:hypothetical protein